MISLMLCWTNLVEASKLKTIWHGLLRGCFPTRLSILLYGVARPSASAAAAPDAGQRAPGGLGRKGGDRSF